MSECKHELAEQDTYIADGYCPLCLLDQIQRLQARVDELESACVHWKVAESIWDKDAVDRLQARVDELEGVGRELINALDDERISDLTHLYERLDGLLAIKALEGEGK